MNRNEHNIKNKVIVKVLKPTWKLLSSLYYFKSFRHFVSNDLSIGLKYLHSKKVWFPHPVGIVIGKGVKLGYNCVIYQNVTIGTKDTFLESATYPTIGDNVVMYANSVVVGSVNIGSNSIIGAGAVVFRDIPENSKVVGNPARVLADCVTGSV